MTHEHRFCFPGGFAAEEHAWLSWLSSLIHPRMIEEICAIAGGINTPAEIESYLSHPETLDEDDFAWLLSGDCLMLRSNHWYRDSQGSDLTMLVAGALHISLTCRVKSEWPAVLDSETRIARVCRAVEKRSVDDHVGLLHLLGWCVAEVQPERMLDRSVLVLPCLLLGALLTTGDQTSRHSSAGWICDRWVEELAEETVLCIDSDLQAAAYSKKSSASPWFQSLIDDQKSSHEWVLLCESIQKQIDAQRLPETAYVLDLVLSDRTT